MVFDVYTDLLLKSVTLQVESPGMQIVTIKNPDGETIFSQIYTPTASGDFIVDLNIELTRGNAYQITVEGSSELAYETAANYPYSVGHVLSIRQSTDEAHLQDRYYYFYDWVVEHHYICGREAIRVEFTNTPDAPVAAFTPSTTLVNTDQPGPVSFFNETENATTYRWDFGDGTNSTVENPVHEYSAPGTYLVTLSASNEATCVATVSVNIVVEEVVVSTTTPELAQQILLFPNPSSGVIQLQIPENAPAMERIVIFDGMGNALWQQAWNGLAANAYQLDLGDYPAGVYHLVLYSEEQKIVKKVVLF
ncbi:MAG: PKD domain-containing protein [Bacteroidota bacterium]